MHFQFKFINFIFYSLHKSLFLVFLITVLTAMRCRVSFQKIFLMLVHLLLKIRLLLLFSYFFDNNCIIHVFILLFRDFINANQIIVWLKFLALLFKNIFGLCSIIRPRFQILSHRFGSKHLSFLLQGHTLYFEVTCIWLLNNRIGGFFFFEPNKLRLVLNLFLL